MALAARREGMLGIVLEVPVGLLRAIQEGIVPVVGMPEVGLEGLRQEAQEGIVRAEVPAGMREGAGLQPTTRVQRGILMRDFRRAAIGHRRNHGHRDRRSNGRRDSLSNGLSLGRSRRVRDQVGLAGITMPEQRGRRAIAEEPVPVVVVGSGEVDPNETSQS